QRQNKISHARTQQQTSRNTKQSRTIVLQIARVNWSFFGGVKKSVVSFGRTYAYGCGYSNESQRVIGFGSFSESLRICVEKRKRSEAADGLCFWECVLFKCI